MSTSFCSLHHSATLSVNYNITATLTGAQDDSIDECTALVLTLIDSLPFLPLDLLEEWLPKAAGLMSRIGSAEGRQKCKDRFWEVLSSGEMDVERSCVCVAWWGTRGGREAVLFEPRNTKYEMSGALGSNRDLKRVSCEDAKVPDT